MIPLHDDNPTTRPPVVTVGIIVLNALVFISTLSLPGPKLQELYFRRGFVPARIARLKQARPVDVDVEEQVIDPFTRRPVRVKRQIRLEPDARKVFLSLVTCMFLHGGWLHLIGNMWFLWIFGNNVEDRLGSVSFLLFYLAGGLAASAFHFWRAGPESVAPVIGASGAVASVLGAYAITWPWARVRTLVVLIIFFTVVDLPALLVLGIWFLGQLLSAQRAMNVGMDGGVAWWAHVGGFIAGLVAMLILAPSDESSRRAGRTRRTGDQDDDFYF